MPAPRITPFSSRDEFMPVNIAGHDFKVRLWTYRQWAMMPESQQPKEAREYRGVGYIELVWSPQA